MLISFPQDILQVFHWLGEPNYYHSAKWIGRHLCIVWNHVALSHTSAYIHNTLEFYLLMLGRIGSVLNPDWFCTLAKYQQQWKLHSSHYWYTFRGPTRVKQKVRTSAGLHKHSKIVLTWSQPSSNFLTSRRFSSCWKHLLDNRTSLWTSSSTWLYNLVIDSMASLSGKKYSRVYST